MKAILVTIVAASCALALFAGGVALAQTNWVDELSNSVSFYKTNYPNSNWDPYHQRTDSGERSAGTGRSTDRAEQNGQLVQDAPKPGPRN